MELFAASSSKRHELERLLSRYVFSVKYMYLQSCFAASHRCVVTGGFSKTKWFFKLINVVEILPMKQQGDLAVPEQMLLSSKKRNTEDQRHWTGHRTLQLRLDNVCQPVSTGVPIKGNDCQPLMIALVDGQSGEIVRSGPEASAKVKIVVLEADFGVCLEDDWTPEEFSSKIIEPERNKRLLSGNLELVLNQGIGWVSTVQFSHTKNWKTMHPYRLGAIVTDDSLRTKIREGFTDSFLVKDRRLDSNMKHHPPTFSDEVWRLDGIAKDGPFHQRLSDKKYNVNTVGDFLDKLYTEPHKLRDILGKYMSDKIWETLVDHARTCIADEEPHLYSSSGSQRKTSKFSNVAHATNPIVSAYKQKDKLVSLNDETSFYKYLGPNNIDYHLKFPVTESSSGINILIPPRNDELDLPQPASLFDESPGPSDIIHPLKSPFGDGKKTIITPNIEELNFPQPAVSFDDKESCFDECTSMSNTFYPTDSSIQERCYSTQILMSRENGELDFSRPACSFDEDPTHFDKFPGESDIICLQESYIKEGCSGGLILIPPEIDELDFPKPVVSSQEIFPSCDSVWDMSYYNDCSSQMTESDNWEIDSTIRPLFEENQDFLQFSVDDIPTDTRGLILESPNNPQNDGNGTIVTCPTVGLLNNARKRYLRNKAKRNWRVLFTVMRWLFVCRNTAGKIPVGRLQVKLSSSYQDLQSLTLTSGEDFVKPTSYENKGFQIFSSREKIYSRNLSMKSEANLHSAVNDILLARSIALATNITQRKYMSKREKARRRWTKLYSVMRWFSVQRNVTKRASYALTISSPNRLCSNQQNNMSFACPFDEDEYIRLFNMFCSLQPRNRIAMNKLVRRRYIADRSFAKRKWKMLFCIMKWLSVRRSAIRVKCPYKK